MKNVRALSSVAVGITVHMFLPLTTSAFSTCTLPMSTSSTSLSTTTSSPLSSRIPSIGMPQPYHFLRHHNFPRRRPSSFMTLASILPAPGASDNLPLPPPPITTTMISNPTAAVAVSNDKATFLTSDLPATADPSPLPETLVPRNYILDTVAAATVDAEAATMANGQLVPPSKSLRSKLNLPTQYRPGAAVAATTPSYPAMYNNRPKIVGHRGSLYEELENTRAGFLACAGYCDAVELDVFLLKDGNLVVFHGSGTDQNPGLLHDYCTNAPEGANSILDLTYEQTQQLQFNPNFAELAAPAERVVAGTIPTLEQVLRDMKPTGLQVKIELKGAGTARPSVELVDRLNMVDQVAFSSFNLHEIETVRQMRPQMKPHGTYVYTTGALFDEVPTNFVERAQSVGASEVHLRYDTCSTDRVRAIHKAGMGSMAWFRGPVGMASDTTNKYWDIGNEDETCFETIMETGVQQLCVNKPRVLYNWIQSKEAAQQRVFDIAAQTITMPPTTVVPGMVTARS